jgi:hypothetical protein
MKLLIGMVLGGLAAWLYSSDRVQRELQHRFASAPESIQQLQQAVATAAASGAQRVSETIDSAPVADRVKDAASEAAFTVWAAADKLGQPAPEAEVAQHAEAPTDA